MGIVSADMYLLLPFIFLFGAAWGSFLGAATYRVPRRISLIAPRSHCTTCKHQLQPLDLIPVISFFLRRGRCAYCGERLSWRYPLVETAAGLLAVLLFWRFGLSWLFAIYIIMTYWALLLAAIDIEHQRLPDVLTLPGILVGFLFNLAWYLQSGVVHVTALMPVAPTWQVGWMGNLIDPNLWLGWDAFAPIFSPWHSVLGIVVGGGVLLLLALLARGGMGWGDVKFLAAIGAFIGPGATGVVLFLGALLGSIVGIAMILVGRVKRRQPIPFGPFLTAALILLIIFGPYAA
jgi:leader peptidase (prepilin peptidase)/N-methyltransferase